MITLTKRLVLNVMKVYSENQLQAVNVNKDIMIIMELPKIAKNALNFVKNGKKII